MTKLDEVVEILRKNTEWNAEHWEEFERAEDERIAQRKSGGKGRVEKYLNADGTLKLKKEAKEFHYPGGQDHDQSTHGNRGQSDDDIPGHVIDAIEGIRGVTAEVNSSTASRTEVEFKSGRLVMYHADENVRDGAVNSLSLHLQRQGENDLDGFAKRLTDSVLKASAEWEVKTQAKEFHTPGGVEHDQKSHGNWATGAGEGGRLAEAVPAPGRFGVRSTPEGDQRILAAATKALEEAGVTQQSVDRRFDDMLKGISNEEIRESGRWYETQLRAEVDRLAEKYGVTAEQAAGVLAALSPQMIWGDNIDSRTGKSANEDTPKEAIRHWQPGDPQRNNQWAAEALVRDFQSGKKFEITEEAMQAAIEEFAPNPAAADRAWAQLGGMKVGDSYSLRELPPFLGAIVHKSNGVNGDEVHIQTGSNTANAIAILQGADVDEALGGYKVRSFYNNGLAGSDIDDDVTINGHMAATMLGRESLGDDGRKVVFGGSHGPKAASHYTAVSQMIRSYFERNGEKYGFKSPKEMQAALWIARRKKLGEAGWAREYYRPPESEDMRKAAAEIAGRDDGVEPTSLEDAWEFYYLMRALAYVEGREVRGYEEVLPPFTEEDAEWAREHFSKRKRFGGPGSGHFGHAGRPGEVGGSAPGEGGGWGQLDEAKVKGALQRAINQWGPWAPDSRDPLERWKGLNDYQKKKIWVAAQKRAEDLAKELDENLDAKDQWADERRENIRKALEAAQEERDVVADRLVLDAADKAELEARLEGRHPAPEPGPEPEPTPKPAAMPRERWLPGFTPPGSPKDAIRAAMTDGEVIESDPLGGGVNKTFKITVEDEEGHDYEGVFKPEARAGVSATFGVDDDGGTIEREVLASQLDELFETNLVPPTVAREVDGKHGSFQLWMDGVPFHSAVELNDEIPREDFVNLAMLDAVMGNLDRHAGNALVAMDGHLIAIDNGFTFSSHGGDSFEEMRQNVVQRFFQDDPNLTDDEREDWLGKLRSPKLQELIDGANLSDEAKSNTTGRVQRLIELLEDGTSIYDITQEHW